MKRQYKQEEIWRMYERLPEELKDMFFSESASNDLVSICNRYGITEDEKIDEIGKYVGWVLLGLLPPEDLEEALEKEIGLGIYESKKIAQEVDRFIFQPVRSSLEGLYKKEIKKEEKETTPQLEEEIFSKPEGKISEETKPTEVKEYKQKQTDIYREPIEE